MRCRSCDYPLWNLPARQCPECGLKFRPSDYEFAANSVRFCCPHCEQSYYGTAANGHLLPAQFNCVNCDAAIDMDEMVLLPADGVNETQTHADRAPWLMRKERGFFRAWFGTIGMALVQPGRLMRGVPMEASPLEAFGFFVLTQTACAFVFGIVWSLLMGFIMFAPMQQAGGGGMSAFGMLFGMAATALGLLVVGPIIGLFIWWLLAHGILVISGERAGGPGRTFQAMCYAGGANVVLLVPCVGQYIFGIWWIVSAVLALRTAQRVSGLRASCAVLPPPLLVVASVVALWAFAVYMMMNAATSSTAFGWPGAMTQSELQILGSALDDYHDVNGTWPTDALALVERGDIDALDLVASEGGPTMYEITLAGQFSLGDFDDFEAARRTELAADFRSGWPDGVIAHRIGDFVFTYHGIDRALDDPLLWAVVFAPNTVGLGVEPGFDRAICIDGTVVAIGPGTTLADQNRRRRVAGLAPLPEPADVEQGAPAVSE